MIDGYLTVTEAAAHAGVSDSTVRDWCARFGLEHDKLPCGGRVLYAIPVAALDAFVAAWPERRAAILAEGRRTWQNVPAVLPSARSEALRRFRAAKMAQEGRHETR